MTLSEKTIDELKTHSLEIYPNECCGLIVATTEGQKVVRVRNIQDEMHAEDPERYPRTARTAYTGHPEDLKRALDLAEEPGNELLAFYHSHPDHDAYFSDEDVAQATPFGEPSYPDALQVVVSVYGESIKEIKAFRWSAEDETYVVDPGDGEDCC